MFGQVPSDVDGESSLARVGTAGGRRLLLEPASGAPRADPLGPSWKHTPGLGPCQAGHTDPRTPFLAPGQNFTCQLVPGGQASLVHQRELGLGLSRIPGRPLIWKRPVLKSVHQSLELELPASAHCHLVFGGRPSVAQVA